ncbi:MAG: restriction endonuclease subunit M, partial [Armatimonadia bacterium]|nr:restriction endonuclease subunit M [Armatimonadia bacterium]
FSAPRNLATHQQAKLVVPLLADKGMFAPIDEEASYCLMASGGFSLTLPGSGSLYQYVLGLLNSRLLFWQLARSSNCFRGGWVTCTKQYVSKLPIRPIDFDDPSDVAKHDRMVSLVETMLDLHKRLHDAKTKHDREIIQRQIDATDRQIDQLVYELYELTDEEIAIVEEATERG